MGRSKRKKKHTHVVQEEGAGLPATPKAMVMERGKVGTTLSQLVLDIRQIMEPFTASKLKVRRKNVMKDFVSVAGPLGVTHFILLSKTEEFVNLKFCRLPRGPTLTFHVKTFSLAHEVLSSLRKPAHNPQLFLSPALLVLNNFSTEDKPSKLMTTMFQNMFPPIDIQTVKLANIRRCVLFHYDPTAKAIEMRHYAIRAVPRGMSKGVKKLVRSQLPDLSKYQDISDYVLGGNVSESEGEEMAGEGEVTLPQDLPGRGNIKSEQSAIRLSELGPRLTLQLVKIEAGLCEGEVLHHEFIHKTKREVRAQRMRLEERRRQKEYRRKLQASNVLRKQREREEHRKKSLAGQKTATSQGDSTKNEEEEDEEEDDVEWYRKEVGEEPDPDMFVPGKVSQKRKSKRLPTSQHRAFSTRGRPKKRKRDSMTKSNSTVKRRRTEFNV